MGQGQKNDLRQENSRFTIVLVIPVLPGKSEAWRRFRQEIEGSRRDEFAAWCRRLDLSVRQIWLSDTLGGAVALLKIEGANPAMTLAQVADATQPFERWLREQVLALHGLDLTKIAQAACRSLKRKRKEACL